MEENLASFYLITNKSYVPYINKKWYINMNMREIKN